MERLTTNKDVSEMGMYELAHNCCYCKDGVARYRDFENDIDARELTRHLLKNYADGDDAFVDDDDFDEEMLELLMYGTSTIEGFIALFYRNMWAMADFRERLKEYEDLEDRLNGISVKQVINGFIKTIENQTCEGYEHGRILTNAEANQWNEYRQLDEQGLLLRLPCGIGDDVYFIPSETNFKLNILNDKPQFNRVYHQNVARITFIRNGWYMECDKDLEYATVNILVDKMYKETWFLSQAEAEQKLKEMESD